MVNKQKILIVDDDENIAELISLYLTKECFETRIVNDGEEALTVFEQYMPNLILLDLMLPGIHGLEVARQISDRSRVIFITSYREHAVEAFDVNAVHYLVKPVTEERLFQALDRAVNQTEKVDIQALTIIKNEKHR